MLTPSELEEYQAEIRSRVCVHCVERLPGGPPCEPLGKLCGVEQHLPALIDAIHDIQSDYLEPYRDNAHLKICDHCAFQHTDGCPCPMDYLLSLAVEAVEAVDARHLRRAKGRQRLAGLGPTTEAAVQEIREIYDEAAGTWTGCDWATRFGMSTLDLNGWSSTEARMKAAIEATAMDAAEWEAAADWLAGIERIAEQAEEHAARSVRAAATGDWPAALDQARRAWTTEFATGRMLWRGFPMTWQRLYLAVEAMAAHHTNATDADRAGAFATPTTSTAETDGSP